LLRPQAAYAAAAASSARTDVVKKAVKEVVKNAAKKNEVSAARIIFPLKTHLN